MVRAVGEMASMKRRKLWKTGEDGLCCSSSAIQTRLDPSSLLEERSETPIVVFVSFVLSAAPQTGGGGRGIWMDGIKVWAQSCCLLTQLPNFRLFSISSVKMFEVYIQVTA